MRTTVALRCAQVPYFRDGDGAVVLVRLLTAFSRLNPELGYVQVKSSLIFVSELYAIFYFIDIFSDLFLIAIQSIAQLVSFSSNIPFHPCYILGHVHPGGLCARHFPRRGRC